MADKHVHTAAMDLIARGKDLGLERRYPEALIALREALQLSPTLVEAWVYLALTHYRLNEYIECLGACDEALKYDAARGMAWNLRGIALASLGRDEEALDAYAHAMRIPQWDLTAAQNASLILCGQGRFDEAQRLGDDLIRGNRLAAAGWIIRSRALRGLKRHEQSHEAALKGVGLAPANAVAWAELGRSLYFLRRFDACLEASQHGVELDPDDPELSSWVGVVLVAVGRPAEALPRMAQAAKDNPADAGLANNVGFALLCLRRFDEALGWIDRALALRPQHRDAAINRAYVLMRLERYDEADASLGTTEATASDQSAFWATKGALHTHRGQYDNALAAIKKATELDQNNASAWGSMAELLIALQDFEKALGVAQHGLELRPHDWDLMDLSAAALRGLGRDTEADEIKGAVQTRLAEQIALLDQDGSSHRWEA